MEIDIQLPGCRSLKEKRRRLRGLKDRFGVDSTTAVSESGHHDNYQLARWTVVVVANDEGLIQSRLRAIEDYIHNNIDGFITRSEWQYIG